MTERKPSDIDIETWVERQIRTARDNGAFDDLPGAGKPIPASSTEEMAWVRAFLKRENLSGEALLPTPLQLRKEIERLPRTVASLRSEDAVRAVVADLNRRIVEWLRAPTGPQVPVGRVDVEDVVEQWRSTRPARPTAAPASEPEAAPVRGRRWWRRR